MAQGIGNCRGSPQAPQASDLSPQTVLLAGGPHLFWEVPQVALSILMVHPPEGHTHFNMAFSHRLCRLNLTDTPVRQGGWALW